MPPILQTWDFLIQDQHCHCNTEKCKSEEIRGVALASVFLTDVSPLTIPSCTPIDSLIILQPFYDIPFFKLNCTETLSCDCLRGFDFWLRNFKSYLLWLCSSLLFNSLKANKNPLYVMLPF